MFGSHVALNWACDYLDEQPASTPRNTARSISTNAESRGLSWQYSPATVGNFVQLEAVDYPASGVGIPVPLPEVSADKSYLTISGAGSPAYSLSGNVLAVQIDQSCRPSAFEQIDRDRERRTRDEAERARKELSGEPGERVWLRIHQLMAIAQEEGPEVAGPAPDSVRAAVSFLAALVASGVRLRVPSMTLDSLGTVFCEWRGSAGPVTVLRFLGDGSIGCALTSYTQGRTTPDRWFGIASAEEVLRKVLDSEQLRRLLGQ